MRLRLGLYLRRLRAVIEPMRARGLGAVYIVLIHFPIALLLRCWSLVAQPLNGGPIQRALNQRRFAAFQDRLAQSALPRFYVIVMPSTLHFLIPCLALLQGHAQLVLVVNGARSWERRLLTKRFSDLPVFDLLTLPLSSVAHGNVITLLLEEQRGNFGIVDHDCYVFDPAVFAQLVPDDNECVLSLFSEQSQSVAITFPLTYFLFFNAPALLQLMQKYQVDARLYREIPETAREAMMRIGLGPFTFWKQYHKFRDTLHVLLAVAVADGMRFRFLSQSVESPAMHVGGTSIGTHHSKDIYSLYIHLRFIELLNDPVLTRRYGFLTAPLRSSAEAFSLRKETDPVWQRLPVVESLLSRLRASLTDSARRHP